MPDHKENASPKIMLRSAVLTLVSSATLLVSFGKKAVIAACFGITAEADIYSASVDLSIAMFSILSIAISNVLVPMYSKIRKNDGIMQASTYASNLICLTLLCCTALLFVFEAFAGVLIRIAAPGMAPASKALAKKVIRFILPTMSLSILTGINTGISDSGAVFSYRANWESAGRWDVELQTNRRLILCPLEGLKEQLRGTVTVADVAMDDALDRDFKPGLYLQTEAFLSGRTEDLIPLSEHDAMCGVYRRIEQPSAQ